MMFLSAYHDVYPLERRVVSLDNQMPNEQLVRLCIQSNRWAQEVLFKRFANDVYQVVAHALGFQDPDLEDVLQDTFIAAFKGIGSLRDAGKIKAWLSRIAIYKVYERRRKRKWKRHVLFSSFRSEQDALNFIGELDQHTSPEVHAQIQELNDALAHLPERMRLAFCMRHILHHDLQSIADALEYSLASAKRDISAAKTRIEARLKQEQASMPTSKKTAKKTIEKETATNEHAPQPNTLEHIVVKRPTEEPS